MENYIGGKSEHKLINRAMFLLEQHSRREDSSKFSMRAEQKMERRIEL